MVETASFPQRGLSLLELMIALALGAALSAAVVALCLAQRQAERVQAALAQMQQNARFIHALLSGELRRAADFGCDALAPPLRPAQWLRSPLPPALQPGAGLAGWEAAHTGPATVIDSNATLAPLSTNTAGAWHGNTTLAATQVLPHSDMLRIWGSDAEGSGATLLAFTPGSAPLLHVGATALDNGDLITVSDCSTLALLQVCRIGAPRGQPPQRRVALTGNCNPGNRNLAALTLVPGSEVTKLHAALYYLGKRGRRRANPPALFRRTLRANGTLGTPEELVAGVAGLQLLYGERRGGTERYVTADQVYDWHAVVSVRVSLLLQSIENHLAPTPRPYYFNGLRYDGLPGNGPLPDDHRLRRAFDFTIVLSQRLWQSHEE